MIGKANIGNVEAVFSSNYAAFRRQSAIPYLAGFEYLNGQPAVRRVLILDRTIPPYYLDKNYLKPVGQWGKELFRENPIACRHWNWRENTGLMSRTLWTFIRKFRPSRSALIFLGWSWFLKPRTSEFTASNNPNKVPRPFAALARPSP